MDKYSSIRLLASALQQTGGTNTLQPLSSGCTALASAIENRQLSDQYPIATDTGCIVSASVVSGEGEGEGTRYYVHHCRFGSC